MASKPKSRSWLDVQTAIATTAIVATLGLWNLFATSSKVKAVQATNEPVVAPPTEAPAELAPPASTPTAMPQVKIMFTPGVVPTAVLQQQVQQVQQPVIKKKNKGGNNGSGSVTQTKTS